MRPRSPRIARALVGAVALFGASFGGALGPGAPAAHAQTDDGAPAGAPPAAAAAAPPPAGAPAATDRMADALAEYLRAELAAGRLVIRDPAGEADIDVAGGRIVLTGPGAEIAVGDGLKLYADGIVLWVRFGRRQRDHDRGGGDGRDPGGGEGRDPGAGHDPGGAAPRDGDRAGPPPLPPPALGIRARFANPRLRAADPEAGGSFRGWLAEVARASDPGHVPLGPSALPADEAPPWHVVGQSPETSQSRLRQDRLLRLGTASLGAERASIDTVRADAILAAEEVELSTCTYGDPHVALRASGARLEPELFAPAPGSQGGLGGVGDTWLTLERPRAEVLGLPVLGWPGEVSWNTAWTPYVPRVDVGRSRRFGAFVRTSWPVLPSVRFGGRSDDDADGDGEGEGEGEGEGSDTSKGEAAASQPNGRGPAAGAGAAPGAAPASESLDLTDLSELRVEEIHAVYAEGSVHLSMFGDSVEADALVLELAEREPGAPAPRRQRDGTVVRLNALADALADRGTGLGARARWRGVHGDDDLVRHEGAAFAYGIRDHGDDLDGQRPDTRSRYRLEAFERIDLTRAFGVGPTASAAEAAAARRAAGERGPSAGGVGASGSSSSSEPPRLPAPGEAGAAPIRLELEAGRLSDGGFLAEYFESDAKTERSQETAAYLRLTHANAVATAFGRWRQNPFQDQVEHLPRGRVAWIGEPFLERWLPGRRALYLSLDYRASSSRRRFADGTAPFDEADDRVLRADLDHRLDLPFAIGPLQLDPFASARFTAFSRTLDRDEGSELRTTIAAGGSLTTDFWRDFAFDSETFGIDSLRHVLTPGVFYRYAFVNDIDPDQLISIDGIEAERKREAVTLSLRNRLLAKQGDARDELIDLDVRATFFPRPKLEDGRSWGLLEGDLRLRPTRRWALRARADWDLQTGERVRTDVSASLLAHERLLVFAAYRFLDDPLAEFETVEVGGDFRATASWGFRGSVQYDFERSELVSTRLEVRRYLHRFVLEGTIEGDFGEDDVRFSVSILPLELFGGDDVTQLAERGGAQLR